MALSFNTSGPCVVGKHYLLSPAPRFAQVMRLIDEEKYFSLHAGHQTGKTTGARWLVRHYNAEGRYACVWVDLQSARELPDPAAALRVILDNLGVALQRDLPGIALPDFEALLRTPQTALLRSLREISLCAPRPLVVLLDEADGLVGPAMVSVLTQVRQGYIDRSALPFPHSLALIGRRQVRDYIVSQQDRRAIAWLGTSSPFNIAAEAPTLSLFTTAEVNELLQQHTTATGQRFLPDAVERIYYLSQGQPWLVNALADRIVSRDVEDRTKDITAAHVDAAKETLILERRTHIDALIARLREERVIRILQPMLIGEFIGPYPELNDDFNYVLGLGLIRSHEGQYVIANPIYREVIPRALSYDQQRQLHFPAARYLLPSGSLDMKKIMQAFQEFWREDGHLAAEGFAYREAGPHLMLMAFLQNLLNGRGKIDREYGLGRKALDLMLHWDAQRVAIEVKLRRDERTLKKGLEQLAAYLDGAGLTEGWLVLFDLRKRRSWKERLTLRSHRHGGHRIHVVGC